MMLYAVNMGLLFLLLYFSKNPPTEDVNMDHIRLALYFMEYTT